MGTIFESTKDHSHRDPLIGVTYSKGLFVIMEPAIQAGESERKKTITCHLKVSVTFFSRSNSAESCFEETPCVKFVNKLGRIYVHFQENVCLYKKGSHITSD